MGLFVFINDDNNHVPFHGNRRSMALMSDDIDDEEFDDSGDDDLEDDFYDEEEA